MLGTRVPAALKRRVRLHCVEHGIEMLRFSEEAVRERLRGERRPRHTAASSTRKRSK